MAVVGREAALAGINDKERLYILGCVRDEIEKCTTLGVSCRVTA